MELFRNHEKQILKSKHITKIHNEQSIKKNNFVNLLYVKIQIMQRYYGFES